MKGIASIQKPLSCDTRMANKTQLEERVRLVIAEEHSL